ncbi:LysR family transcriptional regulator [Pseudonocardiaceae bacterium YIM PH 21723]|nr:LysR family transcriptional regulator [Pseudonocardiaceae bacterium YIM PH 21723]
MLNLERLRVLHAIATTGSVRAAADTLHVTTSAISQQITRLEREVGLELTEKQGRGIRLTTPGIRLAEHAARLLSHAEAIEADLSTLHTEVTGELTIAAVATAARALVPPAIVRLQEVHPGLRVSVREQEPSQSVPAVHQGHIDMAIIQDWPDPAHAMPDSVSSRHLLDDPLVIALPGTHPLAGRSSIPISELNDIDWVAWPPDQLCHDWLLRILGPTARIRHTASEHSTQLSLVAAGLGVALLPTLGADPVPANVRLIPLETPVTRCLRVIWRTPATDRPAIQAVLSTLGNQT